MWKVYEEEECTVKVSRKRDKGFGLHICELWLNSAGEQCRPYDRPSCVKYDAKTGKHTISWADDSMNWEEDLLCCDKVQEWRFVQEDEDVDAYIESLQAKAPQTAPSLMSGGRTRKQVQAFSPSKDGMNDSNIRQCNKRTKRVDGEHEGEANEGDEAVAKAVTGEYIY